MIRCFLEFVYSQCKFKVFIILFYVLPRQSASRLDFPPRSLPSALFLKMQEKKLFKYTTIHNSCTIHNENNTNTNVLKQNCFKTKLRLILTTGTL